MKNWKAKTIIAGTILLLIVASVYYYIALPAIIFIRRDSGSL